MEDKLKNVSFVDERILKSVTIFKDSIGSLGIQVMEGSDGKAYIQSVVPYGPASLTNNIFKGDQIIAVNGQNLLNLKYSETLEALKTTGLKVEIILSQLTNSKIKQIYEDVSCSKENIFFEQLTSGLSDIIKSPKKSNVINPCEICSNNMNCKSPHYNNKYTSTKCNLLNIPSLSVSFK